MNLTIFQHVPYESPGHIVDWIEKKGYSTTFINFFDHPVLPEINKTDTLIIMGGPMNIHDDDEYSWLPDERDFLRQFILSGKKVLGICLGSQMVADAMGAEVRRNHHTEIGWFKIKIDKKHLPENYDGVFQDEFTTFHWHGDTFNIPEGINTFASSKATLNQGFIQRNIAALQFHPEITLEDLKELIRNNEEVFNQPGTFVQPANQILKEAKKNIESNRMILFDFLEKFFG